MWTMLSNAVGTQLRQRWDMANWSSVAVVTQAQLKDLPTQEHLLLSKRLQSGLSCSRSELRAFVVAMRNNVLSFAVMMVVVSDAPAVVGVSSTAVYTVGCLAAL